MNKDAVLQRIENLASNCLDKRRKESLSCIKYLVEHTKNVTEYNGKVLVVLDDGHIIPISMKYGKRLKHAVNYFAKVHHKVIEFDTRYKEIREAFFLVLNYWLSLLNKEE